MHRYTNRLIGEKSPYLLQHAHNPVEWYPWSDEAFEKAALEDRPIFLSIGYATCHWCHVMERESFENEEIAALMNDAFVCIKVDREERPDIDQIYMSVCQMMTRSGGWPLTIIMTSDRKPFHAATYIAPEGRFGRIGMKELIPRLCNAWKNQREKVLRSAGEITDVLQQQAVQADGARLDTSLLEAGHTELLQQFDPEYGGFGLQPKFPTPHRLIHLLRHGTPEGIAAVERTLEALYRGGIFDQIGYGFHRYSTDREWLLPHFEKMLYDQALLVLAYLEAHEVTGKTLYADVVRKILTYVQRDMTAPGGGFYSAEDADSEGEEGLFYTWTAAEMKKRLGNDYEWVSEAWNIREDGNFRDEATGLMNGRNIPRLSRLPDAKLKERLAAAREKLFAVREKRIHPLKDTKILADWNGLMIAAFARAGRVFGDHALLQAAVDANAFIESNMRRDHGLWHRWREGETAVPGQLEDYAFQIFSLLELYDATFDMRYLETALHYSEILAASFVDERGGGFFMTSETAEPLIVRPKELYDGAVPSGNSVQMLNLLRLARLTGRTDLEQQAADTGMAFSGLIERSPSAFSMALTALLFAGGKSTQIVVAGHREREDTRQMLNHIRGIYDSGRVVLIKDPDEEEQLAELAPYTRNLKMLEEKATVYICRNFACEQPVNSLKALQKMLEQLPAATPSEAR